MEHALAVYRLLCAQALADGELAPEERALLALYAQHLGLRPADAAAALAACRPPGGSLDDGAALSALPAPERAQIVRMLLATTFADGRARRRERRRAHAVARALHVGPLQFAGLVVEAEHLRLMEDRHRRAVLRAWLGSGLVGLALLVALFSWPRGEARGGAPAAAGPRGVVDAGRFREIERDYEPSLLLIATEYALVHPRTGHRRRRQASGSGFFVTGDGLAVTCKHVVEPWKFSVGVRALEAEGYALDPDATVVRAWRAGAPAFDAHGELDERLGASSARGTLRVAAAAEDRFELRRATGADGPLPLHALDEHDLALLALELGEPVRALPLRLDAAGIEKLEPVMVLGFPQGAALHEGRLAVDAPSLGMVRKVERSIFVDATIVPGNSGGPVVDAAGRVLGVATRTVGDRSLGGCVRAAAILPLLERAGATAPSPGR